MKRSPLRRTSLKRGKSQLKRAPIKPKPRRGGAMPQASYDAVMMRAGYRCEAQLSGCLRDAHEWHHRQRRRDGSDTPSNGLALCRACHHHITSVSPAEGRKRGLVVHFAHPDPSAVPVLIGGRTWVLLDDSGGMRPAGAVDDGGRAPEVIC